MIDRSEELWQTVEAHTQMLSEQLREQDETMFKQAKQIAEQRLIIETLQKQNFEYEKEVRLLKKRLDKVRNDAKFDRECHAKLVLELKDKLKERSESMENTVKEDKRTPLEVFFGLSRRPL